MYQDYKKYFFLKKKYQIYFFLYNILIVIYCHTIFINIIYIYNKPNFRNLFVL